jgi:Tfp pilus assembly protein PilE
VRGGVGAGASLVRTVVAIVAVGAAAAVAIPLIASRTAHADVAAARADLQKLATAQESWFYERAAYARDVAALKARASPGVTLTVVEATATGWSATAVAAGGPRAVCAVFYGAAAPVPPATTAGQVACE